MIKSAKAVEDLLLQWGILRTTRGSELPVPTPGNEGLDFDAFETIFILWKEQILELSKSKWINTPEYFLADASISRRLVELLSLVTQASASGLQWMLVSNPFADLCLDASQRISALSLVRTAIAKQLAKELERSGIEQLGLILEAGAAAELIEEKSRKATTSFNSIGDAWEAVKIKTIETEAKLANIKLLHDSVEESQRFAGEKKSEVAVLHSDIVGLRTQAESKLAEIENRTSQVWEQLDIAKEITTSANEGLKQALLGVRKQGLAGAFSDKADKVQIERIVWLFVFGVAIGLLVWLSVEFANDLKTFNYETLLVALLRRVALAAPMIWMGWYSAKQISRIGRIQEDYEYKAATAIAFESYKREVEASESDALMTELLKTAIRNFGDNPVRLYESSTKEPATPTEDVLATLEKNGTFKLLEKLRGFIAS